MSLLKFSFCRIVPHLEDGNANVGEKCLNVFVQRRSASHGVFQPPTKALEGKGIKEMKKETALSMRHTQQSGVY